MVGSFRFGLSMLVVFCHLAGLAGGIGSVAHVGYFAVFVFYLLSGYFISTVLRETYQFRFVPFFTNRILRLYPQYYIIAILTVLVVTFAKKPIIFQLIQQDWSLSTDFGAFLANVFIFPFPFVLPSDGYILVPQSWSIGVEILCYGLLWLTVARRPQFALAVAAASLSYHVTTLWFGWGWGVRYFLLPAALLPFSIGSYLSWNGKWRERLSTLELKYAVLVIGSLWAANIVLTGIYAPIGTAMFDAYFYANLVLGAVLIFLVIDPRMAMVSPAFDRFLGKMSYPIFLSHWIVAFVVRRAVMPAPPFGSFGFTLFLIAVPAILLVSYALVLIQERSFDPIRDQIRSKAGRSAFRVQLDRLRRRST